MSFFCEGVKAKEPDLSEKTAEELSGKTAEELASINKELTEQKTNISAERLKSNKIVRLCDSRLKEIDNNLKIITKELKRREDIEEAKNMISEDIKKMEGFELLSEDELSIITAKMNKTDYRKYGNYPRYLDLERICGEVINMKKKYPKWILSDLSRGGQYDTLPPHTFYRYEYKDEYGSHFNLGGITVL